MIYPIEQADLETLAEQLRKAEAIIEAYKKVVDGEFVRLDKGDFLIVRFPRDHRPSSHEQRVLADGLHQILQNRIAGGLMLADDIKLEALSPEDMLRAGWVRKAEPACPSSLHDAEIADALAEMTAELDAMASPSMKFTTDGERLSEADIAEVDKALDEIIATGWGDEPPTNTSYLSRLLGMLGVRK